MKFNLLNSLSLLLSAFIIVSCGNSGSNSESSRIVSVQSESLPIKIHPSSSGHPWKTSYSLALDSLFADSEFNSFFDTKIVEEDLQLAGCSNLNELNYQSKKIFYTAFLAAIAEAESDFEVTQETYNRVDGTMNIGMLQIDRASANRHGGDYFNRYFKDEDLINPELNLMIGALILKNQVTGRVASERLFPEHSYYWQVLTGSKKRVLRNLQMNLWPTSICRNELSNS
ncbi:MAG: transglycosylase SLT domain-containing protein [Bacteriovorax sp.]|nr:transglycosylase SLT domain-containing protein [Bacteriovorax sp.]